MEVKVEGNCKVKKKDYLTSKNNSKGNTKHHLFLKQREFHWISSIVQKNDDFDLHNRKKAKGGSTPKQTSNEFLQFERCRRVKNV